METLCCVVDTQQGLCVHNTQLHICFLLELQIRDDYPVIFSHLMAACLCLCVCVSEEDFEERP